MHSNPTTCLPAEQLMLALRYLDNANAMQQQLSEDQALADWIDTEEQRHTDPYGRSKEGDIAYWTQ